MIRPDLTATTASGTLEIFTVETPETVTCTACNAAWRSLTAYTLTCDAALWVAVPWAVRASTILRLHQLNLRAQVLGL